MLRSIQTFPRALLSQQRRHIFDWFTKRIAVSQQSLAAEGPQTLYSFGSNDHYQLGLGDGDMKPLPMLIQGVRGAVSGVSAGEAHTVVVMKSGKVITFGWNELGQAGQDEETEYTWSDLEQSTPQELFPISHLNVVKASCGARHTALLTKEGQVLMFGNNDRGQLGNGTVINQNVPSPVQDLRNHTIVDIAMGKQFSTALTSSGVLYAWGDRSQYQLGDGTNFEFALFPVRVQIDQPLALISAGSAHVCALASSGELYSWGLGNIYKESQSYRTKPQVLMKGSTNGQSPLVGIACGHSHSLVLDRDGVVYAWGDNTYGQLGSADKQTRHTPAPVLGLERVVKIAAGAYHSCAVTSDGQLYTWGHAGNGRLGLGSEIGLEFLPKPHLVKGSLATQKVIDVAAGVGYTIAVVA